LTKKAALSSVGVAAGLSIALALGIWAALGAYYPGEAGFGSQGLGAARGLVLIAVGAFALTMAVWSSLRRKRDQDL